MTAEPREDLVDQGLFHYEPTRPRRDRRPTARGGTPTMLTGDDLVKVELEPGQIRYGHGGLPTLDDAAALAKVVHAEGHDYRYIRFGTIGAEANRPVDPYAMYAARHPLDGVSPTSGRAAYEFRAVSRVAFENYLQYLRSRTARHYREAMREAHDA